LLSTLGTGKQIGMLCANSIDMVVACNAIHKAGQVWVPVNIKLEVSSIDYILQHAEVSAVVLDQELLGLPGLAEILQQCRAAHHHAPAKCRRCSKTVGHDLDPGRSRQSDHCPRLTLTTTRRPCSCTPAAPRAIPKASCIPIWCICGGQGQYRRDEIWRGRCAQRLVALFHCAQHALVQTALAAGAHGARDSLCRRRWGSWS
jgi:long-chain acyl-CoA synthetase